ncbi:bifunctional 23S rRNA (guanine(2069)-N(7))-methyltransferase RlmK/23S rRNA (guanine(2445)-N(2))-methyltransferase RlmL [Pseudoalteromonas tunicata]|uniref:bifunctional 23S rRNA (guanine(2069)-N(7))-methyltransferase RlmK/23S rRNA (guanine(2445)-N(2))-methyltransferase RlmL n=1 Tax=Pseudoalteromonas tunicata TaxID=314281 RepID=UPI00273EEB66|nr:bifunctional 23S rRNA (guanine(2069)-N(7))-methyltransferase RlmK/23S rRNA (guanine(2445)-N(2))-methyltransferase RlmL [Pseudoalteromonas tunicata]MDP4985464.1 bifunctional 23S rRNA (guanine(2069)-N(7))-methyltransferase RlmK/23S rRNA (guanine(2445)-N(2))-methyltransferase RlmL [Pseudoalteromonas tunicata]
MQFIALTSIGIEQLLQDELTQLGASVLKLTVGSVTFESDTLTAQKICLSSRFATRIMMLIASKDTIKDKEALYNFARFQPWQEYFGPKQTFLVDFSGTNAELKNTQFAGLVVKDAIVDYFQDLYEVRPNVDKQEPNVRVVARLNRETVNLYIDYSGPSLSQRGYRTAQGKAPIKEHLAAALIKRSGWLTDITQPLYDPCCGAGTLLIEAVSMARNEAPGLEREQFAFERLPGFKEAQFLELKELLAAQVTSPNLYVIGHDVDRHVLGKAKDNCRKAGFGQIITLDLGDATKLKAVAKRPGVVISNLPYGERLGGTAELISLYRLLGQGLKQHFANWHVSMFGSDESLLKLLKLVKHKQYKFKNGPIDCLLNNYLLDEKQVQQSEAQTGLNYPASEAFGNRLKKNNQALKKWLKKDEVVAYRLYDADIPEYNVAVDVYLDHVIVYEYAPPKQIDEEVAHKRLQDVIFLTGQQLEINPDKVVVKQRKRQKGDAQYQSFAKRNESFTVTEYGAKFKVNLHDYLDTGLFLDHRLARRYIQQNSQDKRFLNLFAYTGSASVHAALGGAKSVTTVDMSKTYLDWAQENFALNNLKNARYHFEKADCLKWLEHATGQYDLIFLDPPTFSNSKRMEDAFDVQRDHIKLFTWVKNILSPTGTLLFSNNKRGFKIDQEALEALGLKAKNITDQTLSPDFNRNKNIHNSWLITYA